MSKLFDVSPSYFDDRIVILGDMTRVGGYIVCVYPPANKDGWRAVVFSIVREMYRGEPARMYRKRVERPLTGEEIDHFRALMATWVRPVHPPIGE